jgi:hypothetical protein
MYFGKASVRGEEKTAMKPWIPIVLMAVVAILPVGAQSNELLDRLLEREELSVGEAAYLVLVAIDRLPESATPEEAAAALAGQFAGVTDHEAGAAISLGEYAYLLMRAFEVRGGVMYRLVPGPRYAARELAYLKIVRGKAHPNRSVGGAEAVQILRRLLDWKEGLS